MQNDEHLFAATEWDKFHREDISLSRAVAACPLAGELFAVCSVMDAFFHLGEGRLVLRAAAAATGVTAFSGSMPSATRKVVALTEEPGHLLRNLPAYAAGIPARLAYSRDGHAGNIGETYEAGRRLTSLDLIAFATLFRDVMHETVSPWCHLVQSQSIEPWALAHAYKKQHRHERECLAAAASLRELLRILVVLRQHLHQQDLQVFVRALFFAAPKAFFVDYGFEPRTENTRMHFRSFSCRLEDGRDALWGAMRDHSPHVVWGRVLPTFMTSLNGFLHLESCASKCGQWH